MGKIGQYHHSETTWRNTATARKGVLIGVELEVHNRDGRQLAADALDEVDFGEYPAPVAERDGSLDEELGVEIILPPLPLQEVQLPDGYVVKVMKALKNSGCTDSDRGKLDGYGMHVNINLADWEPKEKLLVQHLLNLFDGYGEQVGRRRGGHGGYHPKMFYYLEGNATFRLGTYFGDRHCAAYIRSAGRSVPAGVGDGNVMEVRLPKTTLEIEHLHQVIDYVFALRNWVRAAINHTEAICFLDAAAGYWLKAYIGDCFVDWCLRYAPDVVPTITKERPTYKKLRRLEYITGHAAATPEGRFALNRVGLYNVNPDEQGTGNKEQALRISKILGKGARLQDKRPAGQRTARSAASIQAAD
jgi:hypothetical protein